MPDSAPRERMLAQTDWLNRHLDDPDLRIVDMRGYVRTVDAGDGRQVATYVGAPDEYAQGHIPGAIYLDWTRVTIHQAITYFVDSIADPSTSRHELDDTVRNVGRKSVTYGFEFFKGAEVVARGAITAVCCRVGPGRPVEAVEIPAALRQKLL